MTVDPVSSNRGDAIPNQNTSNPYVITPSMIVPPRLNMENVQGKMLSEKGLVNVINALRAMTKVQKEKKTPKDKKQPG